MKIQKHAMKLCQEHAKPTGGDITLTKKPCGPIRTLKKSRTTTSQAKISGFTGYTTALQPEFLKIFILAGVFKKFQFQ